MHDSGSVRAPGALCTRKCAHYGVCQRAGPVPGSRMHDEAGRFVNDGDVLVAEDYAERNVLRRHGASRRQGEVKRNVLALTEPVGGLRRLAVDRNLAFTDHCRDRGPGEVGKSSRKRNIQPLSRLACGGNQSFVSFVRCHQASRTPATSDRIISPATPTTTALSAMLNTGHQRRSMKSTTYPSRIRSIRLPTAPPRISASASRKNSGSETMCR